MRRVCGDDPAQNTPGNYVADKMIIHRHKAHEHGSTKNGAYHSTAGHRNQPHRGEAQDPAGVAERKATDVVATLKRMKTIPTVANERWVVIGPSLRLIATTNISQRRTEFIRHDQAEARDQQHFLPAHKWSPCPSNHQHRQH